VDSQAALHEKPACLDLRTGSRSKRKLQQGSVPLVSHGNLNVLLSTYPLVLMVGAVNERLRRAPGIRLHALLGNAALVRQLIWMRPGSCVPCAKSRPAQS
jgi:hypothetical protein